MKKFLMIAVVLLAGVSAAMAQKNVKAVGVGVNYGSEISNVGFGAKFQYGLTDAIRIEPSFNYYLEKDGLGLWDANVNFHYLFNVAEKLKLYPLAGAGYANCKFSWGYEDEEESISDGQIAINLGGGAEYQLNDKWSVGAELKYQIISDFNQLVAGVSLTYKF